MKPSRWLTIGTMDELARLDSPVHRLDTRAKAIVTAAFVITVMSFPRYEVSALTPFLLYPLALMAAGRIPPQPICRKILLALPFALVIGVLNPILDRHPVAAFGSLVITGGWLSFASIILRFILTVSAALVLVACTGMFPLGVALERLGVPRIFVMQLLFLYRYLFVIADEGSRMIRSVEIRSAKPGSLSLSIYGSLVGHLLLRSMDRAERIYRAMVARGFDGTERIPGGSTLGWSDGIFMAGWLMFFAAARAWNLAAAMGSLVAGTPR